MSNPHKLPLCVFYDIDKCRQGITIKTSYQEVENSRKNQRCIRSACALFSGAHFFFNYLMDYYQNETIVQGQRKQLESKLQEGEEVVCDAYKCFEKLINVIKALLLNLVIKKLRIHAKTSGGLILLE